MSSEFVKLHRGGCQVSRVNIGLGNGSVPLGKRCGLVTPYGDLNLGH